MGHITTRQTYKKLRERLDRLPVGAPGSGPIYEILKTLYTAEEAELAAQLPLKFKSLHGIARKLGVTEDTLRPKLEAMADKGLVLDFELGGKMRYMLTPTVVGFFEFSMMRVREDVDQSHLAGLFHEYLLGQPDFAEQLSPDTQTSLFRTLVHEEALPESYAEVLDWERATWLVENAGAWAVGLCYCRHIAHHRGADCQKFRMECCMTLGPGADYTTRHGLAKKIDKSQALDLLTETREAGLVHLGDNVQRNPTFICNCCGCCCEVMLAFKKFKMFGDTFTSNFIARVDTEKCNGCRKCAKACPVDAIDILTKPRTVDGKKVKWLAKVDPAVCLGCGVCELECKFDAMHMEPREKRRIAPEDTMTRVLSMALEQGKLQELLIDEGEGPTAHAANAMLGAILKLPPAKQLLARQQLRSRFVDFLVSGAKKAGVKSV